MDLAASNNAFFQERGYTYLPEWKQYRKKEAVGFKNVVFATKVYGNEYVVEVNLGLRLDAVEELVYPHLRHLKAYAKQSTSFICSVGRILEQPYWRYTYATQAAFAEAVEHFRRFLDEKGLPLLQELFSLEALERLYNERPRLPASLTYNQRDRAFRGLALAQLLKRSNTEELYQAHREQLEALASPPTTLADFDSFYQSL